MEDDGLRDDVAKLLGRPPYNHPGNICWNDNYFAKSLNDKYGEGAVNAEIARQQKPKHKKR
jgi:hypothetical protein